MPDSADAAHSDAALLIAVQNGNKVLSQEFYLRLSARISGIIRSLRPDADHHYTEDALSTTMLMLFNGKIKRFDEANDTLLKYLFRRTKNAIKKTDRENRSFCVNRRVKTTDGTNKLPPHDATKVYDNTVRIRSQPTVDTGFMDREVVEMVMAKSDPMTANIAIMRYVKEYHITKITVAVGLDRFAVARCLKRFCQNAARLLALTRAA